MNRILESKSNSASRSPNSAKRFPELSVSLLRSFDRSRWKLKHNALYGSRWKLNTTLS
ncbi:hypothetical protein [Leptospira noguchii]|uniref:hypothetical protein n=1 Tax=Leptospira noguchii TaxID=28182 RepID=UPI001FB7A324|nr:hypothetical protein [Leptospira noguchii]UOG29460.1 hypothetical protein MAL06_12280 [Leptospira noguchii]UOG44128.1 hypothetical protein MAL01_11800 [Leptospira noguchii]